MMKDIKFDGVNVTDGTDEIYTKQPIKIYSRDGKVVHHFDNLDELIGYIDRANETNLKNIQLSERLSIAVEALEYYRERMGETSTAAKALHKMFRKFGE